MVALLGQRDELLKLVEAAFDSEIIARGNEITVTGPDDEPEKIGRLFEELVTLLEQGLVGAAPPGGGGGAPPPPAAGGDKQRGKKEKRGAGRGGGGGGPGGGGG